MMEYNIGDKVIVKSLKWYNKNKDGYGDVDVPFKFLKSMSIHCGKHATIIDKTMSLSHGIYYTLNIDQSTLFDSRAWSKEMLISLKDLRKKKLKKLNEHNL